MAADSVILGFCVVILVILFTVLAYKSWDDRRKSSDFLLDAIIAYKVGMIEKKAKENDINLIYPDQKDDFIDKIEKGLEHDLNRAN